MSRLSAGRRRGRSVGPDDRGISTSLSHVFGLAITSVLLVSVIVTASGYVDDRRAAVAEQQLATVGDQLASEVHRVDALAARGGNVSTRTTLPASVSGEGYSVVLADGPECRTGTLDAEECLVLSVEGMDVTERVPVNVSTDVALESEGGGEFVVSSSGGGGGAATDDVAAVTDRELRIGVGREFTVDDYGRVASPVNRPPVAKFDFTPGIPNEGDAIRFSASSARDPDGSIDAYQWYVDGGETPDMLGETVTRSLDPGTHEVTLRVTDNEGGSSNVTKTVRVSGLRYDENLTTHRSQNTVAFTVTNTWNRKINVTQVFVDPENGGINGLNARSCGYRCSYHLGVDETGDGYYGDERRQFEYSSFEDGGLIEDLDTRVVVGSDDTVGISLGEFSERMDGETITVGIRYEVNGQTNSTVFTDTVGAPRIERFALERESGDEVDAVIESTKPLGDVEADLGGSLSGTATEADFEYEGQTADGVHTYVDDDVNAGAPGVVKVNLTRAEGGTGVESRQTSGGSINRSTVVFESEYSWDAADEWDDATSERGVVHASYGDRSASGVELGYAAADRGGDGLVGYWTFDEGGSDASSGGNDGAVAGDPAEDLGVFGSGAYRFDGTDDYVDLSEDLSDTHGGTSSLSAWIRTTAAGDDAYWNAPGITGVERDGGSDDVFWGWIDSDGKIGFHAGDDSVAESPTPVTDGNWHHVAMTYRETDGQARVYVDGRLVDEVTTKRLSGVASFGSLARIENSDPSLSAEYFDGSLDEVRAYDRELTEDDVERLYNASRNGTLTTDWQSGAAIDGGDLALEYRADVPSSTRINVTVLADTDGDGTADEESDVVELTDGGTQAPVTGLSGTADRYRLRIELASDTPLKSPTLRGAGLEDTSP